MAEKTDTAWQIIELDSTGKADTIEAFFISRLGHSGGKRTFKDLMTYAKEKMTAATGQPAILLSAKGGKIIGIKELT